MRLPSAVVYGSLEAGMTVCLALIVDDRARFETSAVAWHARWCSAVGCIPFADSAAVLDELERLAGPDPEAAARELAERCRAHGQEDVADVLDAWCAGRSGSSTTPAAPGAAEGGKAA